MKCYYDLHIHTALSPCADADMTPNNIVNMAILKGLDFIAITDHNSAQNVKAVIECAKGKEIVIIPGIEVESSEEVHLLCFFPDIESVLKMGCIIKEYLPEIKNRPEIFGDQILFDADDQIIEYESTLLMTATSLSIDKIKNETEKLGGVVVPSHIDRNSYSIISNLAFIPKEYDFTAVEVSKYVEQDAFIAKYPYIKEYIIVKNSDAHSLAEISERVSFFDIEFKTIKSFLAYLSKDI